MLINRNIMLVLLLNTIGVIPTMAQTVLPELPLDHVILQFNAEHWVNTTTAKVTVSIDATLTKEDLVAARTRIMTNLNKIAAGDWHITQFNRSQDNSGLEKLNVQAQARIPENLLSAVNANALAITKPGTTYKVQDIEFTPSLVELEAIKAAVRGDIYQQVKNEIAVLNKAYPEQNYKVHSINFSGMTVQPNPAPTLYRGEGTGGPLVMAAKMEAPNLEVSNLVQLTAMVDIAATRHLFEHHDDKDK